MKNVEKVFDNGQPTLREWKLKAENEELKRSQGRAPLLGMPKSMGLATL